jgi:hypothetical protein
MRRSGARHFVPAFSVVATLTILGLSACDDASVVAPIPNLDYECPTCDPSKSFDENLIEALGYVEGACPNQADYLSSLYNRDPSRITAVYWADRPNDYAKFRVDPAQELSPYNLLYINTAATNWLGELVNTLRHEYGHAKDPDNLSEPDADKYMKSCDGTDLS